MDDTKRVRDSSGESSGPEKWFNESNNNAKHNTSALVADDPPFFLPQSCNTTPPDNPSWPPRTRALPAADDSFAPNSPAESSASAVYRNIIDDLTVENKKLKSTLKKYERAPDALFEVRVHSLTAQKKQELESLLQDFVTNIGPTSPETSPDGNLVVPARPLRKGPAKSRLADSGYGSSNTSAQKLHAPDSAQARRKKIQNYLHELPAGIYPKRSGPLTEKEKRNIVVRSLEQLFAGRDPAATGHQHQIQQERVAQSAARADRRATAATGAAAQEGPREAHMMSSPPAAKEPASAEHSHAEQRPTRPLDLDPHRAQIPSENMEYIRHLGFSPPDAAAMDASADTHGWISLIVLINMAQLHYTSVTPEFVRKAISEHSKMLELSPDGRKVRWRGGTQVTLSSSGSSPDDVAGAMKPPYSKATVHNPMSSSDGSYFSVNRKLAYSPLFHSRDDSLDEKTGDEFPYQKSNTAGRSSVQTGSNPRSLAGAQSSVDDGPIIFYRNKAFYTDLSGNHGISKPHKSSTYKRIESDPLGSETSAARLERLRRLQYEKGPLSRAADPTSSPDGDDSSSSPASAGSSLELITAKPRGEDDADAPPDDTPSPIDFEVSGVGGVHPADNFAISVRSRQLRARAEAGAQRASARRSRTYPVRIRDALRRSGPGPDGGSAQAADGQAAAVVDRLIVGSKRRELPASKLPEAVYFHATSSEEEDDSKDDSEDDGEGPEEEGTLESRRMDWIAKYRGPGSDRRSHSAEEDEEASPPSDDEEEAEEDLPEPVHKGKLAAESARRVIPEASSSEDGAEESSSDDDEDVPAIAPRRPKELSLKRARQSDESVLVHLSRPPKSPKLEQSAE